MLALPDSRLWSSKGGSGTIIRFWICFGPCRTTSVSSCIRLKIHALSWNPNDDADEHTHGFCRFELSTLPACFQGDWSVRETRKRIMPQQR